MSPFDNKLTKNDVIFFSQRHIIGIDFKEQPSTFRGLAIIDENVRYTTFAQGIYRMRKLNKGQFIDVCIIKAEEEEAVNKQSLLINLKKMMLIK